MQSRLSLSLSLTLASALTLFGMSFVTFVLLLLLLYLCLANINSWTAAGSSRAAAVWAGRGIERTNAKCVGDDSFSWVIASARLCDACRLLVLLLLSVCVCVCIVAIA